MTYRFLLVLPMLLTACFPSTVEPKDMFFKNLMSLCGQSFEGRMVSDDAVDADFASKRMVMHVASCENGTVKIPFHVGEDQSRTWVITNTSDRLILKHDHRHLDGSEDEVSQYGGTSRIGTKTRQEFPVDAYSIDLFQREGLTASVTNVWALEIKPGKTFAYEMSRPERFFRTEFDLGSPIVDP